MAEEEKAIVFSNTSVNAIRKARPYSCESINYLLLMSRQPCSSLGDCNHMCLILSCIRAVLGVQIPVLIYIGHMMCSLLGWGMFFFNRPIML